MVDEILENIETCCWRIDAKRGESSTKDDKYPADIDMMQRIDDESKSWDNKNRDIIMVMRRRNKEAI